MAAHVEHLRWSLTNANEALQGKPYQGNWSESWNTPETDKIKRDRLRKELRTEFETLMKNLRKQEDIGGDT